MITFEPCAPDDGSALIKVLPEPPGGPRPQLGKPRDPRIRRKRGDPCGDGPVKVSDGKEAGR